MPGISFQTIRATELLNIIHQDHPAAFKELLARLERELSQIKEQFKLLKDVITSATEFNIIRTKYVFALRKMAAYYRANGDRDAAEQIDFEATTATPR